VEGAIIESTNLDSEVTEPIPWSRAAVQLEQLRPAGGSRGPTCWLSTIDRDGRPYVTGVVGNWYAETLYFVSGPRTRKVRNLAVDQRCSFAISLPDLDLVLDGTATRVTDSATLTRLAERYTEVGWPLSVDGDVLTAPFWAPTAPAPPWYLHAFTPATALGVATASTGGATRWHFSR
jgi:hypothetical protein